MDSHATVGLHQDHAAALVGGKRCRGSPPAGPAWSEGSLGLPLRQAQAVPTALPPRNASRFRVLLWQMLGSPPQAGAWRPRAKRAARLASACLGRARAAASTAQVPPPPRPRAYDSLAHHIQPGSPVAGRARGTRGLLREFRDAKSLARALAASALSLYRSSHVRAEAALGVTRCRARCAPLGSLQQTA